MEPIPAADTVPAADAALTADTAVVICAAGSSVRMGGGLKKEYRPLPGTGLTVLGAAAAAFAAVPGIAAMVIAVPANGAADAEAAARAALPPERCAANRPRLLFVPGGSSRRESVRRALSALAACNPAYVLIHDGARPWISRALILRLMAAVREYQAVIPLLPLTETPKETESPLCAADNAQDAGAVLIKRHLNRACTGGAQTPQAFLFTRILAAHEQAAACACQTEYTDDAAIWGAFCGPVAAIPGEAANKKITFPEDLP
jgi:2-C-methyl-D-erythritol 4-phosphate cytidylyltransferase